MFPPPNSLDWDRCQGFWHVCFQSVKGIITVFTKILLYYSPEELNEVQLTVKLWKEDTKMPSFFNHLLDKRFLLTEIRLKLKNSLATACIRCAFFALPLKTWLPQPMSSKDSLDSLGLIRECGMVRQICYWLDHLLDLKHFDECTEQLLLKQQLLCSFCVPCTEG
jgi:hypothetical protein